jgi:hypothetical protein
MGWPRPPLLLIRVALTTPRAVEGGSHNSVGGRPTVYFSFYLFIYYYFFNMSLKKNIIWGFS